MKKFHIDLWEQFANLQAYRSTHRNPFFITIFNIQHTFFLFQFVNEWENLNHKMLLFNSSHLIHSLSLSLIVQKNHTFFSILRVGKTRENHSWNIFYMSLADC